MAQAATHCLTDAECGSGECCFKHDGPFLVSKRKRASADLLAGAMHSSSGEYNIKPDRTDTSIIVAIQMQLSFLKKLDWCIVVGP